MIFLDEDIIILSIIIAPKTPLYLYSLYITPIYGDQNEVVMNFMCIHLYTEKVANGYLAAYKGNYDFTAYYIENPT